MPNMQSYKTPMPEQNPNERINNFKEVSKGYTEEMAINEANRCLNCKNKPCVSACPVNVNIPAFISEIKNKNYANALNIIHETNSLPAICGRVCPQESQCEAKCVRGIKGEPVGIGRLERFVADFNLSKELHLNNKSNKKNGIKIAVIGSGPSGLACANDLCDLGFDVTIFEALHKAGGVLSYGIPEFRLPKNIVEEEINLLKSKGIKLKNNVIIGKTIKINELLNSGFKAIYIATGAGAPNFMGIEGENLNGVYSANEFLTRVNLMKAYEKNYATPIIKPKNIAIIGGGNVAMDAARTAKRLGAQNVYIIYRRSLDEMPARKEEIIHAKEEKIEFKLLCNPVKINSNDNINVSSIECIKMQLGEPDSSGRRRPIPIENSNFNIEVDSVIIAIGNSPNEIITQSETKIKTNNRKCIIVNENLETSMQNVFAGGDAVTGAATVILAMGTGKKAAIKIAKLAIDK